MANIPLQLLCTTTHSEDSLSVQWLSSEMVQFRHGGQAFMLWLDGAETKTETAMLPWAVIPLQLPEGYIAENPVLLEVTTEPLTHSHNEIADADFISNAFQFNIIQKQIEGRTISFFQILPLKKNGNLIEKLLQVRFSYESRPFKASESIGPPQYKEFSVLSSGHWVRIPITETGIYRLNRNQLVEMGFDVENLNPGKLALYGNGGNMLPEANNSFRHDDLFENAIMVEGESDGVFDENDALYFYGQASVEWKYTSYNNRFSHQINYYSDTSFYFLTVKEEEPGKRIQPESHTIIAPTATTNIFLDRQYQEQDLINLIHSGKEWFGEEITKANPSVSIDFHFPNRITERPVMVNMQFAGRSITESLQFDFSANGQILFENVSLLQLGVNNSTYARESQQQLSFQDENESLTFKLEMEAQGENSKGWLNYIRVNAWRELKYTDNSLQFRYPEVIGADEAVVYQIANATANMQLWDVSHPLVPKKVNFNIANEQLVFQANAETLKEYILFKPEHILSISGFKTIANQNLHGISACDMLIITHPDFIEQAETLAQIHFEDDGLVSEVVNIFDVYNEFGSGSHDITALRDFARMLYYKSEQQLKYILLFGDASFDYKEKTSTNTNFVPTYQASNSTVETLSFVSDDYFGLFDSNEGLNMDGIVDVGIGRLPVRNHEEANTMIEKIRHYLQKDASSLGEWRNNITFMADDADDNLHFRQAETLANTVDTAYSDLNVQKVYLDAYRRMNVSGGYRYPDASERLLEQLDQGTLILNYTGHGGVNGLTNEQVFTVNHINSLSNWNSLTFFITATCEFSRFDNPSLHSAGEQLLLNPAGGAIGLMTTTRLAFAHSNFGINQRVYASLFAPGKQQIRRLGDVMRMSKNPTSSYVYNFVLLGNPALRLKYPEHRVEVLNFNNLPPDALADTLGAMAEIVLHGQITGADGLKQDGFNGYVYPKLYDKKTKYRTLANDQASYAANFEYFDKLLYRGKASVMNGTFTIHLKLPKTIAYQFGKARFSFYAVDTVTHTDAGGYYDHFVIGGTDENTEVDQQGPEIHLFIDDLDFVDGDQVATDATAFVRLFDPQGINFIGNDIGRDIVMMHESPAGNSQTIINHLYQPALDDFSSGSIVIPLQNLAEGSHTLSIKAWDLHNNSGIQTIHFNVNPTSKLQIKNLRNAPNPFTDETFILFDHNKPGEKLFVEIDVYNVIGRHVASFSKTIQSTGLSSEPISIKMNHLVQADIQTGIFIYRMNISDTYNHTITVYQKMIFSPNE